MNNGTTEPSKIRFSVDAKLVGSMTSTPLQFRIYQQDPNYEARRGIDANMDGDMVDGATHFQSIVRPTVIESSEYSHISFTLDQGDISASITRQPTPPGPPVNLPLNPEFDPLRMIHWSISFGFEGFGFDAGNNVSVDNIRIESVPEPASFGIAVVAACSFVLLRRSRIAILA